MPQALGINICHKMGSLGDALTGINKGQMGSQACRAE